MGQKGGNMNEIAGPGTRNRFSAYAPADFADSGEHVSDRFLLSVMMNSGPRSRLHFEQAAPQIADAMPSVGAIAARRSEPGVCAVP
jgi:hypothetical protein